MTTQLQPAPIHTPHHQTGAGRLSHAENPDNPGYAFCGRRLKKNGNRSATNKCVVCDELKHQGRFWIR